MDCKKALLFYFYPKNVGCGKKRVVEQYGLRTAALERYISGSQPRTGVSWDPSNRNAKLFWSLLLVFFDVKEEICKKKL